MPEDFSTSSPLVSRQSILKLAATPILATSGSLLFAEELSANRAPDYPEFPRQDLASVQEVVGASHFNFDRVRELVTARPTLALATWDWGFGDWESALGAASHVGRVDIAEFLIENGARPDLFTHAMLGHLDVVQAAVAASPGIQRIHGPHGITLLQHALAAGRQKGAPSEVVERATALAKYLTTLGDADTGDLSLVLSESEMESYLGSFRYGPEKNQIFQVKKSRQGFLSIEPEGRPARPLRRVEEHGFAPAGAPHTRIRFTMDATRAVRLTIHDPQPVAVANRI